MVFAIAVWSLCIVFLIIMLGITLRAIIRGPRLSRAEERVMEARYVRQAEDYEKLAEELERGGTKKTPPPTQ